MEVHAVPGKSPHILVTSGTKEVERKRAASLVPINQLCIDRVLTTTPDSCTDRPALYRKQLLNQDNAMLESAISASVQGK